MTRKTGHKVQHNERKSLNFENWCNREVSKGAKLQTLNSIFFFVKNDPYCLQASNYVPEKSMITYD